MLKVFSLGRLVPADLDDGVRESGLGGHGQSAYAVTAALILSPWAASSAPLDDGVLGLGGGVRTELSTSLMGSKRKGHPDLEGGPSARQVRTRGQRIHRPKDAAASPRSVKCRT